ncbi:hypothetical protein VNO78_25643 [Psophocarpus tetragonolobus]|uniref:Uncharacterized protein n=1 Tax=Psophocarpus tetragonolobus TaxID=3891 RepID=A0AAN9S6A2_PSOTE
MTFYSSVIVVVNYSFVVPPFVIPLQIVVATNLRSRELFYLLVKAPNLETFCLGKCKGITDLGIGCVDVGCSNYQNPLGESVLHVTTVTRIWVNSFVSSEELVQGFDKETAAVVIARFPSLKME